MSQSEQWIMAQYATAAALLLAAPYLARDVLNAIRAVLGWIANGKESE